MEIKNVIISDETIKRNDQMVASLGEVTSELFSLRGKTAVVTGAGRGIGKAISIGAARFGADVAVVDIDEKNALETKRMIESLGQKAEIFMADVSSFEAVENMMKRILETFGSIDILINNAGVGNSSSFPEVEPEEWDRILKMNLGSAYNCSKAAAEYMIIQKSGAIVNIGSSLSSRAAVMNCLGGSAEYCVSKAGVQALTRSSAQFLAKDGIRVNAVAPGPVDSPMHAARREALAEEVLRVPLGRIQNCDDVVGTIVFLSSEAARFITGQTIHVNGGMLMTD